MLSDWLVRLAGYCVLAFIVCSLASGHPIFHIKPNAVGRPFEPLGRAALIDLFSAERQRAKTLAGWWMILIRRGLLIAAPLLFVLAGCFSQVG